MLTTNFIQFHVKYVSITACNKLLRDLKLSQLSVNSSDIDNMKRIDLSRGKTRSSKQITEVQVYLKKKQPSFFSNRIFEENLLVNLLTASVILF